MPRVIRYPCSGGNEPHAGLKIEGEAIGLGRLASAMLIDVTDSGASGSSGGAVIATRSGRFRRASNRREVILRVRRQARRLRHAKGLALRRWVDRGDDLSAREMPSSKS